MRTSMLPLVDVVRGDRSLANQPVDTLLTSITEVFVFYSRDIVADSGHAPMIRESRSMLNPKSGRSGNWFGLPLCAHSGHPSHDSGRQSSPNYKHSTANFAGL